MVMETLTVTGNFAVFTLLKKSGLVVPTVPPIGSRIYARGLAG